MIAKSFNAFKKFTLWFTPARREAFQTLTAALLGLALTVGLVTDVQMEAWIILVAAGLQLIASISNLWHLDLMEGWALLRPAIYSAALAAAPALAALTALDMGSLYAYGGLLLGVVGSLVAVFAIRRQNPIIRDPDSPET